MTAKKPRPRGDGKVVMEYREEPSGRRITERVYPCEANAWLRAHGLPDSFMFGKITRHYHEDAHPEPEPVA